MPDWILIGFRDLVAMSLAGWAVLILTLLAVVAFGRLTHWMMSKARWRASGDPKRCVGWHKDTPENEAWLYKDDLKKLGVHEGTSVVLRFHENGASSLEIKLAVRSRYQRRGTLSHEGAVLLSENNFDRLVQHFRGDAVTAVEQVELAAYINSGWWPGDHPDPSIKMGFWITVWVTLFTTIIAVAIELIVP